MTAKAEQLLPQGSAASSDPRTILAIERTEYALERTQLAWIRTTLGFLGSGIALDKGMEIIHKQRLQAGNALFESSHVIGIALSVGGTHHHTQQLVLFQTPRRSGCAERQ